MSQLLTIALTQLGVKEIQGEQHNQTIINYAQEAGFKWVNNDETPWCSIFLNWCTQKANLKGSGKANARSWLQTGTSTQNPVPGDIVIYWRGSQYSWTGHVGIFMGYSQDGKQIFTLGGNQNNSVSIAPYKSHQLLGFRKLITNTTAIVPHPILKFGDIGEAVKQLQKALVRTGIRINVIDDIFGFQTEEAVKTFQTKNGLSIDGIYGQKTAKALSKKLNK